MTGWPRRSASPRRLVARRTRSGRSRTPPRHTADLQHAFYPSHHPNKEPPGPHLSPSEFNEALARGATVVDCRNRYESEIGRFQTALTPDCGTFRECLPAVKSLLVGQETNEILLYCTGGIRCEKASAFLLVRTHACTRTYFNTHTRARTHACTQPPKHACFIHPPTHSHLPTQREGFQCVKQLDGGTNQS